MLRRTWEVFPSGVRYCTSSNRVNHARFPLIVEVWLGHCGTSKTIGVHWVSIGLFGDGYVINIRATRYPSSKDFHIQIIRCPFSKRKGNVLHPLLREDWICCTSFNCSCTWLLSPPKSASPQVTTDPSERTAANACPDAWICCTSPWW